MTYQRKDFVDESTIRRLYLDENKTYEEVADGLHVSVSLIQDRMKQYGLKARNGGIRLFKPFSGLPTEPSRFAYMAGLVDGEGSIIMRGPTTCQRNRKIRLNSPGSVTVQITNTDKSLMDWLVSNFGGHVYLHDSQWATKQCYQWRTNAIRTVYAILQSCTPFLIIKRDAALKAKRFCELRLQEHGCL